MQAMTTDTSRAELSMIRLAPAAASIPRCTMHLRLGSPSHKVCCAQLFWARAAGRKGLVTTSSTDNAFRRGYRCAGLRKPLHAPLPISISHLFHFRASAGGD